MAQLLGKGHSLTRQTTPTVYAVTITTAATLTAGALFLGAPLRRIL